MTKEQFYATCPGVPIPVMDKLLSQEPFILINNIPVTWVQNGVNWEATYDFDETPMPIVIEPPVPSMTFSSHTVDATAFGVADGKMLINIKGVNRSTKLT